MYPQYMKYFDGDELPYKIRPDTSAYFGWKCDMGHHYNMIPPDFIKYLESGKEPCPYCDERLPLRDVNTFYTKHKELVDSEWDFVSNYAICDPNEILDSCRTNVWLKCQNNPLHKYKMSPAERLEYEERNMEPCQICRGYRRNKSRIYRKKR